jgi:hypothetical protein
LHCRLLHSDTISDFFPEHGDYSDLDGVVATHVIPKPDSFEK